MDESDVDIHTNSEINRMQISETDKSINDKYNFIRRFRNQVMAVK